jgi:hypothetical protein
MVNKYPLKHPVQIMPDEKELIPDSIQVKVSFRVPQRMPSLYAHHMMIQPGEHEVLLSFFEVLPPPSFGPDEEAIKKIQEVGVVAECVARITIAKDRFPSFARAMHGILEALEAQPDEGDTVQENADDNRDNPES